MRTGHLAASVVDVPARLEPCPIPHEWATLAGMPDQAGPRTCLECGQEIRDPEKFLLVSSADGKQQFVHTLCFTNTTFDPDRFATVHEPDSDAK